MFCGMTAPIKLPALSPVDAQHPVVVKLLEVLQQQVLIIQQQSDTIQRLQDEIAQLTNRPARPKIRPSQLERPAPQDPSPSAEKRPGSAKRRKTEQLEIHETQYLAAEQVPPGSTFKGYQEYTVQDLVIKPHNTCGYF